MEASLVRYRNGTTAKMHECSYLDRANASRIAVCSLCNRRIRYGVPRFVLSSKEAGGSRMPINDRLACIDCYKDRLWR
jgi:hypothetical protein